MADTDQLFEDRTPLGFAVHLSRARWGVNTMNKHPAIIGPEATIKLVLGDPEDVRQSRSDAGVFHLYMAAGARRWVCAVAREAGEEAILVTAYRTDAIYEGERVVGDAVIRAQTRKISPGLSNFGSLDVERFPISFSLVRVIPISP